MTDRPPVVEAKRNFASVARLVAIALATGVPLAVTTAVARGQLAPDGVGAEDAYIFLRYGRHLAAGLGWVWNPDGLPVEGTTSALWTLITAAAHVAATRPVDLLVTLSFAAVAATLPLWIVAATALPPGAGGRRDPWSAASAALAFAVALDLAARPAFAVRAVVSAMDGGLWCAAVLIVAATHVRLARAPAPRRALSASILAQLLLAATRPESLLVGPALALAAWLAVPGRARLFALPLAAAGAAQVALAAWRTTYFGWPLPNTYYAKVGDDLSARLADGASFLVAAGRRDPTQPLLWAIALAILLRAVWPRRWRAAAEPADAAVTVAAAGTLLAPVIVLIEGGGWSTLPLLRPLAATCGLLAIARLAARWVPPPAAHRTAAVAVALAAASSYATGPARWSDLAATTALEGDFELARRGLVFGAAFEHRLAALPERPTLGVVAAGALPFAYGGASRDLLGLNDLAIAHATRRRAGVFGHAAFSADALFAAPPELLFLGVERCPPGRPPGSGERTLFRQALAGLDRDPRFAAAYRRIRLPGPPPEVPPLCAWARRDWLASAATVAWEDAGLRPSADESAAQGSRGGYQPDSQPRAR